MKKIISLLDSEESQKQNKPKQEAQLAALHRRAPAEEDSLASLTLWPSGDYKTTFLCKFPATLLHMLRRECGLCWAPLHASHGHSECAACLGRAHAEAVLTETDCFHYESMSLTLLCLWIAFFNNGGPAPPALSFLPSQLPLRTITWRHGAEQPGLSDLTVAQVRHALLSPQHFDPQSSATSDLTFLGRSEKNAVTNDSILLTASDSNALLIWATPTPRLHSLRQTALTTRE